MGGCRGQFGGVCNGIYVQTVRSDWALESQTKVSLEQRVCDVLLEESLDTRPQSAPTYCWETNALLLRLHLLRPNNIHSCLLLNVNFPWQKCCIRVDRDFQAEEVPNAKLCRPMTRECIFQNLGKSFNLFVQAVASAHSGLNS